MTVLNAETLSGNQEPHADEDRAVLSSARRATILVIDDEQLVVRSVLRTLQAYEVIATTSAAEGVALLGSGRDFDLILCDLMMPDMDGMQLYAHATQSRPELRDRFVFMTGGAYSAESRAFIDAHRTHQLEKPFDTQSIRVCVERALRR